MSFALVALLAFSSAAEPPIAPERQVVLIVTLDDARRASDDALYAAFLARGVAAVSPRERVGLHGDAAAATEREPTLDDVKDALVRARAALSDFDTEKADEALDEGERALLALPRPDLASDVYQELLLVRADGALSTGDRSRALQALRLLAAVAPERVELHAGLYPPALVELYAEAREESARAAQVAMVVNPLVLVDAPARVFVDLRPEDERGTLGAQLSEGPHVLTVVAEGAVTVSERVDVQVGAPVVRAPVLAPRDAPALRAQKVDTVQRDPRDLAALAAMAQLTGATVVVVRPVGAAPIVYATDVGARDVPGVVEDPVALAAAALGALDRARRPAPPPIAAVVDDEAESSALWPFSIAAGISVGALVVVAVGASIATVAYLLRPIEEEPDPLDRSVVIVVGGSGV